MRPLLLHIEDGKFKAFLTYVKTLDYVTIDEVQDVPQWQQEEVDRRVGLIDSGQMGCRSWDEASKDIFKK